MNVAKIMNKYIIDHSELFENEQQELQQNEIFSDDSDFKDYILNALKNLKSKIKTLTVIVGNSNNSTCYSILLGKSEVVESGFGFMRIVRYKIVFKWLKYPKRYIYLDFRDLPIHFDDGSVISGITNDLENPDDTKVLASNSLKDIIQSIKDLVKDAKNIITDIKDII
ncbi:MAG: hypothetical protein Ta2E_01900 [Mycoplasmoidaceae bacterium]|nr:MAG: hypothetical protein Ta2E_01900 [Mycoplasmoidaceae bacterium]